MADHIKELLSDYIDNEINKADKQRIEQHLDLCADCHNHLQELMSLREQISAAYQTIEIPARMEDMVMEKIQQASFKKYSGILNRIAVITLLAFGIMFLATTSPFLTVGLPIFHSLYSVARGLIYAIPSIISAIPYVFGVITVIILSLVSLAIIALKYLVQTMGKTVRTEDI